MGSTLLEQAREVKAERDRKDVEAKTKWTAFETLRKSAADEGVDFTKDADAFERLDVAGKDYDAIRDEVANLGTKWARLMELAGEDAPAGGLPTPEPTKAGQRGQRITREDLAKAVVDSDIYRELKSSGLLDSPEMALGNTRPIKVCDRVQLKTLLTGGDTTSAGAFVVPDFQTEWVVLPRRAPVVADLVTFGTTESNTVEYVEQTSRTNAAAETAEAGATGDGSGAAAESATAFAQRTATVRDITHFLPATKNAIADAGQLSTIIESELVDGIRERLDGQLVSGNGTAPNLKGILNTSGILTRALGSDARSDAVHKGITAIRLAFFEPTVVGFHPSDYESVRLEKDAEGTYVYGPPSQSGPPTVWGLLPVVSPVFPQGTVLIGDYRRGATAWLREGLAVAMSDSHSDFFVRRLIAVLGVMRLAYAVQRPKCFCTVTGF